MSIDVVSPLRQRMIEDMTACKLSAGTQRLHISSCKRFAAFLQRSPETATVEDVRRFQLHLAETGTSIPNRNRLMTGLRFLFRVTLRRLDLAAETLALFGRRPHQRVDSSIIPATENLHNWRHHAVSQVTGFYGRKCIAVAADSAAKMKNTKPGPLAITATMTSPMPYPPDAASMAKSRHSMVIIGRRPRALARPW